MKSLMLMIGLLTCAIVSSAQQAATVQMQCHDLSTNGNYLGPDEVLINGMACHQVKQVAPQTQAVAPHDAPTMTPTSTQTSTVASTTAVPPATTVPSALLPATPESMKIVPGARVYIAPMDGFENYLAAAFGKKQVQLVPVFDPSQAVAGDFPVGRFIPPRVKSQSQDFAQRLMGREATCTIALFRQPGLIVLCLRRRIRSDRTSP